MSTFLVVLLASVVISTLRLDANGQRVVAANPGLQVVVKERCCSIQTVKRVVGYDRNKRPVYVDERKCRGSCTSAQSVKVITDGGIDNFVGPQPTSPSDLFQSSSFLSGAAVSYYFDKAIPWDRRTAHTIKVPSTTPYCADIVRIKLKFCVKASPSFLAINDYVYIWNPQPGVDTALWYSRLSDLFGTWGRNRNACHEATYLPGDANGIFNYVNTYRELHIAMQDDTFFDYTQLTVYYDQTPKTCQAKSTWSTHVPVLLHTGWTKVKVTHDLKCDCDKVQPPPCQRQGYHQVFYANSIFETKVDVGRCVGTCTPFYGFESDEDRARDDTAVQAAVQAIARGSRPSIPIFHPIKNLICQELRTHIEFIKGPNGGQCVEVVDRCDCRGRCYRKDHFEEYVEVIKGDTGIGERRRVFNVGKCAGDCLGKDQVCQPGSTYNAPSFRLRDGTLKVVNIIRYCTCK